LEALKAEGFLEKIEPYQHSVGHCYRCRTTVEPYLSEQWFVKVKPLAEEAVAAVETGATRIIPDIWTNTFFEWMNNIRDWCISRQIWWGHRIPAWTCQGCGKMIVAMEAPEACPDCKGTTLVQETDVLDTWFSSALWPFSTMGWPDHTETVKTFYPTSVLVTGFDILFFWVARMMMMGLHFMKEVPFRDVYIHALVRDAEGKKMSKSKGNVIDPLYVIDEFGTDAFRFTLAAFAAQGRDIKLSEDRIEGYRHFINKLWNAFRFSLMHLKDFDPHSMEGGRKHLSLADRWILSRLDGVIETTTAAIDGYKFNEAASALYRFVWHEFCDWYLEIIKPVLYGEFGEDGAGPGKENGQGASPYEATRSVLWSVLNETVRLLHPLIPFVTEELWHKLPGTQGSVMKASFPVGSKDRRDGEAEATVNLLMGITSGIRNVRGEMNVPPARVVDVIVQSADKEVCAVLEQEGDIIVNLAKLASLKVTAPGERPAFCAAAVFGDSTIFVSLKDIIDFEAEEARLHKEIGKINKELDGVGKKLGNEDFLSKAPEKVVEGVRAKQERLAEKKNKLEAQLEAVRQVAGNGQA
ncbi:MAG: valine--tRNA ligase, partial [Thermodesulfobacteriota bacterium]|nr:valine--tRNA ligase [Thermodesulfobacteriota bacterium]